MLAPFRELPALGPTNVGIVMENADFWSSSSDQTTCTSIVTSGIYLERGQGTLVLILDDSILLWSLPSIKSV